MKNMIHLMIESEFWLESKLMKLKILPERVDGIKNLMSSSQFMSL